MNPYESSLLALAQSDNRVVVMTAENRAAIRELPGYLGDRFVDVGIGEQTLVGMAAGLALRGKRPVVHALAAFLTMRAFEFIRTDIGIPHLPVILVGHVPGFLSESNGPTHQAIEDIALMRTIPGMNIFCPKSQKEFAIALPQLIESNAPWYVRQPGAKPASRFDEPRVTPGRAILAREGSDVAILTYGAMTGPAMEAAGILEARQVSARIVEMHTLKPLDAETLLDTLRTFRIVITLEDHFRIGGLGSATAEFFVEHLRSISTPGHMPHIFSIALNERWFTPAPFATVLSAEGFSPEAIAKTVLETISREVSYA